MNAPDRLSLCWRILRAKNSKLLAHAERELPPPDGDEMQALMNKGLRELVLVFGTHGHSGFSANHARQCLDKLLGYEPLRPLTGEPDEWIEASAGVFQNRRCGRVFKQSDRFNGQAYDLDGKVFTEPDGYRFTNADSMVPIVFPYTPTTEYAARPAPEQDA